MPDVRITSHNQQGGITAQNVNTQAVSPISPGPKKRSIWPIVVGIFSIVGVIVALLTYLGFRP